MTKEEAFKNLVALNAVCGQKDFFDKEFEEALLVAEKALEQQPSWISVNSDIKPKEGQEVLTIYEGYYKGQYSKDRARCYYANGGIAFESLESMAWKYSISRIRAWMPIPEYEEGE